MTHKYQGGIEVLVILLDTIGIVLNCLPLVHRIEVEAGIIGLDGGKKALRASWKLPLVRGQGRERYSVSNVPLGIDLQR